MKGKTLAEFTAAHDRKTALKHRIDSALAELGSSWEYEGEFRSRAAISNPEWASLRNTYAKHIIEVKAGYGRGKNGGSRRAVAGTVKFANKLREALTHG